MTHTPLTAGDSGNNGSGSLATYREKARREKWIYVWDINSRMYINQKISGRFHHCSFVAGKAVKAAGSVLVEDGRLVKIITWSGSSRRVSTWRLLGSLSSGLLIS